MKNKKSKLEKHTKVKVTLWVMTVFYLILFPVLFYAAFFSVAVLDPANLDKRTLQQIFVFVCFCIPLSIPISIYFMWRKFHVEDYPRAMLYCLVPVVTFILGYFLIQLTGRYSLLN